MQGFQFVSGRVCLPFYSDERVQEVLKQVDEYQKQETFNEAQQSKLKELMDKIRSVQIVRSIGRSRFFEVKHSLVPEKKLFLKVSKKDDSISNMLTSNEVKILEVLNRKEIETGESYVSTLLAKFTLKDQRIALLMPLYNGDLFEAIPEEGFSEKRSLKFLKTMLEILCFIKRHGVLHLDIKPENILLDIDGTPRLGDFDLSVFEGEGLSSGYRGTLEFSPPEAVISSSYGFYSDIFSTGVSVCQAYLGDRTLFGERDPTAPENPSGIKLGSTPIETVRNIFVMQQKRAKKEYSESLKQAAIQTGKEQLLCDPSEFEWGVSFEELMDAKYRTKDSDPRVFALLQDALKQMLELDFQGRASAESILEQLDRDCEEIELG